MLDFSSALPEVSALFGVVIFLFVAVAPGAVTHLVLYGWHRAPANAVYLTKKQWLFVAGMAALPVGAFSFLVSPWGQRLVELGTRLRLVGLCLVAMVSVCIGLAPSHEDDWGDDDGEML